MGKAAAKEQSSTSIKPAQSTALASPGFTVWQPKAAQKEAQANAAANQGDFLKLVEGDNYVFVMPPLNGMISPFVVVWEHGYWDENEERFIKHVCPTLQSAGKIKHCRSCAEAAVLMNARNKADKERGYDMRAKRVAYCNALNCAIDPDTKELLDSNVRIASFNARKKSAGPYELILDLVNSDASDPTNPFDGAILCINKWTNPKDKMDVQYKLIRKKFIRTALADLGGGIRSVEEWAANCHNLLEKARLPTDAEIDAIIDGDDDEDDRPARRGGGAGARAPQQRGRSAQDELEEGDDEEDLDDDE